MLPPLGPQSGPLAAPEASAAMPFSVSGNASTAISETVKQAPSQQQLPQYLQEKIIQLAPLTSANPDSVTLAYITAVKGVASACPENYRRILSSKLGNHLMKAPETTIDSCFLEAEKLNPESIKSLAKMLWCCEDNFTYQLTPKQIQYFLGQVKANIPFHGLIKLFILNGLVHFKESTPEEQDLLDRMLRREFRQVKVTPVFHSNILHTLTLLMKNPAKFSESLSRNDIDFKPQADYLAIFERFRKTPSADSANAIASFYRATCKKLV